MALSLKFRGDDALRWGTGIGHNLAASDFDDNTWAIQEAINDLQTSRPQPDNIASFTSTATTMTEVLESGTQIGPIPLPSLVMVDRGEWQPTTVYAPLDVFTVTGSGFYITRFLHTSAASFDPEAVGADVTAGSFQLNGVYVITALGTTDFTLIGAASNTVGVEFTATGPGTGTGTAGGRLYKVLLPAAALVALAESAPGEGDTITASLGEVRRIISPATALDALTLVLPPNPANGDTYELITTQTITTLTVNGAGSETIIGSGFALTSRAIWTYQTSTTSWVGP